ncbi:MarR family winged helix-turn-helix transcriptional regulator [Gordonia sp. NPDC127522]|uniref:MarR family winged helix-turn-helix transcriptional regulator n=1 Tax=Gordonia sp. NPDC127522 TaxID=3345390 RepID=UPI00363A0801
MPHPPRPPSLTALPSYLASYVAGHGRQYLEDELARRGLKLAHNAVLTALVDFGPAAQQDLAESLRIDKSHLVKHIDLLEARGWLRRESDPDDRRRHRINLTTTGRRQARDLQRVAQQSQRDFLRSLDSAEQATLIELLTRVLADNDSRA